MKPLRPFFSYYGAKWRIAKTYPAPEYPVVIEPFAGSACYSLHHHDRRVVLVEKNPVLAGIWAYLVSATPAEIRRLPFLRPDQTVEDLKGIPQEARDLIGFWCCRSGAAPAKGPNAWMKKHAEGYPGSFWGPRAKERIASQVEAIRHWEIWQGDYRECLNRVNPATYFVDPPYQEAGKFYTYGPDQLDYPALAEWCRTRNGQVIVCENEGANWLPFQPHKEIWGTRKKSKEVVWVA